MKDLRGQARVTAFLRNSLAEAPQDVLKLEAMARTEGLLGERQRMTHAKPFKRGKRSLRIRSVRAGFGPNGSWRWELPCNRDGASTASAITREPVPAERCIPVDWVAGVARLDDNGPPTDVHHAGCRRDRSRRECDGFLVAITSGHHGPRHSCDLVGERDRNDLGGPPRQRMSVGV